MLKEFLEYAITLGKPHIFDFDDRTYSSRKLNAIPTPSPSPLIVHSLTGLVDYYKSNITADNSPFLDFDKSSLGVSVSVLPLIHVANSCTVNLYSRLSRNQRSREHYLQAQFVHDPSAHSVCHFFNSFLPVFDFITFLQTNFVPSEILDKILLLIGNLSDSSVKTIEDDGVSQSVKTHHGIRQKETTLPKILELRPFRSFYEIEQPPSLFTLRLKPGQNDELPSVGLFLVNSGQWEHVAIRSIRDWLYKALPNTVIIA